MNCHKCGTPQPDAVIISAAASINAKRNAGKGSRPGAKGMVRNGCHHEGISRVGDWACKRCDRLVRWSAARNTFLLVREKEGK